MKERYFIKENKKKAQLEEFLSNEFSRAGYSHCDIQRTPLALRITIFAQKPGMIIGRGGQTIDNITKVLKEKFGFENPQLNVQEIENPDLNPHIVSRQIAFAVERGIHYKRVVSLMVERVMNAGAVGVAIRIGGKIGGAISRTDKFSAGYLKFSGDIAETVVKTAYATAKVKLGLIGIQVKILDMPLEQLMIEKKLENSIREADKAAEEKKEVSKKSKASDAEKKELPKEESKNEKKEEPNKEEKEEKPEEGKSEKDSDTEVSETSEASDEKLKPAKKDKPDKTMEELKEEPEKKEVKKKSKASTKKEPVEAEVQKDSDTEDQKG